MPLIVQSTKQNITSFNLLIINSQMQIATKSKATLVETEVAIVNMYQNGTTAKLSSQAQKAAHALAQYIHANKASKKFAFVLGKDHQDQQLLLLTISSHSVKTKTNVSLQKVIQQASINTQKQEDPFLVKQLLWVSNALHEAEFGILFWIYQHQLSSQAALSGTKQVPATITAVNFQRVKTPYEQLQDEAWAKTIAVIQKLTSRQLKIHANDQQLPSQAKITASDIVLAIQKIIISDDKISKAASKLMKEANIKVQLVDKTGAMIITIKNYGHDKIIAIFGFKAMGTILEVAQAKIDVSKDGASLPTWLTQVFHGQTPSASHVNAPLKDRVTFKFKSATAVNSKGESTFTYEVDANPQVEGTTLKDITFTVSGFETKDQKDERKRIAAQAKIDAAQNKIGVTSPTRLNQVFHGQTPSASHVNAPLKDRVTFKFKSATAVNSKGESTFTYEVDANPQVEGTTLKDITFTVSGFETQDQATERITAQAKINVAQNKIEVILPTKLNQVFHDQIPTALDVIAPTKDGVTFKFQSATAVNSKGESALTYEVDANPQVEGTTLKDITFTVSGFETKDQKDERKRIAAQAKINAAQNKIGVTSPTRLNQVFHGQTPTAFHVIAPTKDGVTFKFKSATAVNDKGASTLTYEVDINPQVKGTTPQDVTFVVSGFETKDQKDAREVIKKRLDTTMQNINDGALVIPKDITSTQFDEYVQAMGDGSTMNKFAETYKAKITSLTIPSSFTTIGSWFKDFNQIISLSIPNSVTTIGAYAFRNAQLTSLRIPDSVTTIGAYAFRNAQLTSLRIPDSVTTIGAYAFVSSPLTTLSLGEKLQAIGAYAFRDADELTSLRIPDSVTTIGRDAFRYSSLTTLSLGNQLQTIGPNAFNNALLTSLIIPDSVTTIGASAFMRSSLITLSLGNQLQTIGHSAFYDAQLTSLRIPDSVTTIGAYAFVSSPLTNVTIFADVALGRDAFKGAKIVTRSPR